MNDFPSLKESPMPFASLPVGSTSIAFVNERGFLEYCAESHPFDINLDVPIGAAGHVLYEQRPDIVYAREVRALLKKYPLTSGSRHGTPQSVAP